MQIANEGRERRLSGRGNEENDGDARTVILLTSLSRRIGFSVVLAFGPVYNGMECGGGPSNVRRAARAVDCGWIENRYMRMYG